MFRSLTIISMLLASSACGQTLTHTNFNTFNNSLAANAVVETLDFNSMAAGDLIVNGDSVDGFEFGFDFDGIALQIGDANSTSSPPHYLGTTDGDLLQDGDDFTLTVAPANAFGIHIITADILLDDDISLTFNGAAASLVALDIQQTLPDGSFVYFLGVTSDQTDNEAVLTTVGGGFFMYNVDDLVRVQYPTGVILGDVNLDGVVNLLDVNPFIDRVAMGDYQVEADCNEDGTVNLLDVDPFIAIVAGG